TVHRKHRDSWMQAAENLTTKQDSAAYANRAAALKFVDSFKNGFHTPFQIWPSVPSKSIENYSLDDVIEHPEKYQTEILEYEEERGFYYTTKYDIRQTERYQFLFNEQKDIFKHRDYIDSFASAIPYDTELL